MTHKNTNRTHSFHYTREFIPLKYKLKKEKPLALNTKITVIFPISLRSITRSHTNNNPSFSLQNDIQTPTQG